MAYVDGFLLAVPKKKLAEYRRIAKAAGKVWRELGAIEFCECAGDDVAGTAAAPFKRAVRLKRGEVLFFSWIAYKSKTDRDRINKKIMTDPRIAKMMDPKKPVFDMRRMAYGGFKTIVSL